MEPKPVQKPYPPIWFGGRAEAALRRAVEFGERLYRCRLDAHGQLF
jgi:alkanesulfonate monooxygenase SsuD/methylene tetrahydromethanopterin reductase-like flavin-dependent oxidoreductase (luciferase family)